MDKDDIIEQLQEAIGQLERGNEVLRSRIRELEAQPVRYENPHTPPSPRRGGNSKKNQKKGHKGVTIERAELDDQIGGCTAV